MQLTGMNTPGLRHLGAQGMVENYPADNRSIRHEA
jgi:hypothetical protein